MKDIAFHITDIAENGIRAGATAMRVSIALQDDVLELTIADNGCGMDEQTIRRATNPFYTTRTTRKVGLGLPFLIQNAEQSGGGVDVISVPGRGTTVKARFRTDNIDCPPVGDLAGTMMLLLTGNPQIDITFEVSAGEHAFSISTREISDAIDGIPLGHPQVALMVREIIEENVRQIMGSAAGV